MSRILIIDDDDFLREMIATTLLRAGHTVYQAADGRQGCNLFDASPVDLVLTDIIMPGGEGIETIIELRRLNPTLPIIAMSGGATHSAFYLDVASRLGASRILPKPFRPGELTLAIAEALAARPPPPPPAPS